MINFKKIIEKINQSQSYIIMNGYKKLMVTSLFIEISKHLRNEFFTSFNINEWINHN